MEVLVCYNQEERKRERERERKRERGPGSEVKGLTDDLSCWLGLAVVVTGIGGEGCGRKT